MHMFCVKKYTVWDICELLCVKCLLRHINLMFKCQLPETQDEVKVKLMNF